MMKVGIYVHIPFCESRCVYCGFYSTTAVAWRSRYVDALLKEMRMRQAELAMRYPDGGYKISTIYLGGGTPSTLTQADLTRILNTIRQLFDCDVREITIEMNPDDVTSDLIKAMANLGVNRISLGIQTFSDERLRFLNRRHNSEQAVKAFYTVRQAGIGNVSIDLMFGFPNESLSDWQNDLDAAVKLQPEHISAYSLMYEEGTPLFRMLQSGKIRQIDDDSSLAMYTMLMDTLSANGYEHYEISNFCRHGKRSIHNSSYWNDTPYLGFGAAAHSYSLRTRSWNVADIKEYISSIESGRLPSSSETIDDATHYNDIITTAMRTSEGVNIEGLKAEYRDYALRCAKNDISGGLLELADGHLRLTRKGLYVSDSVMSDLIYI